MPKVCHDHSQASLQSVASVSLGAIFGFSANTAPVVTTVSKNANGSPVKDPDK